MGKSFLNFEEMENEFLLNPKELYSFLKNRLIKGRTVYFFLDEIQNVEVDEKNLGQLIQEEIDRINAEKRDFSS